MSQPYLSLLKSLADHLPGVDADDLLTVQCLRLGPSRIDFSFEPALLGESDARIVLRCNVAQLAEPASEQLCRSLLRANNLWAGTEGATLGLRGDRTIILSEAAYVLSTSPAQLSTRVKRLAYQASVWAEEFDRTQHSEHAFLANA